MPLNDITKFVRYTFRRFPATEDSKESSRGLSTSNSSLGCVSLRTKFSDGKTGVSAAQCRG
jgi:hypothetical protein